MAVTQVLNCFVCTDVFASNSARVPSAAILPKRDSARIRSSFTTGSPILARKASYPGIASKGTPIRCDQSAKGSNGLDVWLGRLAMVGFATAVGVEIATGKGLLENFGFPTPLPVAALVVTGLVGVLTAIFIFQSGSEN